MLRRRPGMITSAAAPAAPTTSAMIARLRCAVGHRGRQHEQQPAVVVVGGEDVRLRRLGPVAFGVHDHLLVEHAHAPLERGADVVVAVLELEPEHLVTARPITSRSPSPVSSRAPRPVPISRPCWSRMKKAALGAG